jgi:hypothetical protein
MNNPVVTHSCSYCRVGDAPLLTRLIAFSPFIQFFLVVDQAITQQQLKATINYTINNFKIIFQLKLLDNYKRDIC